MTVHKKKLLFLRAPDKKKVTQMKKLFKEISQIISGVLFLTGGLALILQYTNGIMLIGLLLIAIGSLIFTVFARGVVIRNEN
jgi:hypothetical protein